MTTQFKVEFTEEQKNIVLEALVGYGQLLRYNPSYLLNSLSATTLYPDRGYVCDLDGNKVSEKRIQTLVGAVREAFRDILQSNILDPSMVSAPAYNLAYSARGVLEHQNTKIFVLTVEEVRCVVEALDLFSRIFLLQLTNLSKMLLWVSVKTVDHNGKNIPFEAFHSLSDAIDAYLHAYMDMPRGASHGIYSQYIPDVARKAYDIQQVLRHTVAWDREGKDPLVDQRGSSMIAVDFDTPRKTSFDPKFNLPTCSKENSNG